MRIALLYNMAVQEPGSSTLRQYGLIKTALDDKKRYFVSFISTIETSMPFGVFYHLTKIWRNT